MLSSGGVASRLCSRPNRYTHGRESVCGADAGRGSPHNSCPALRVPTDHQLTTRPSALVGAMQNKGIGRRPRRAAWPGLSFSNRKPSVLRWVNKT